MLKLGVYIFVSAALQNVKYAIPAALSEEYAGGANTALYFSVKEFLIMEFGHNAACVKERKASRTFQAALSVIFSSACPDIFKAKGGDIRACFFPSVKSFRQRFSTPLRQQSQSFSVGLTLIFSVHLSASFSSSIPHGKRKPSISPTLSIA